MLAELRRESIARSVNTSGPVTTEGLARQFEVSLETIRRDLLALDELGLIQRVHGGAIPVSSTSREPKYSDRLDHAATEKTEIGHSLAKMLPRDGTVFLDLGTTIDAIVAAIPKDYIGTIFTTSLRAAISLSSNHGVKVITSGGVIRHDELSVSGPMTSQFLSGFFPDLAVISSGCIDVDHGITDYNYDDIAIKQLLLQNSQTSIVVADSTKFGKVAPYHVCDLTVPTRILTTTKLPRDYVEKILLRGGEVSLADRDSAN